MSSLFVIHVVGLFCICTVERRKENNIKKTVNLHKYCCVISLQKDNLPFNLYMRQKSSFQIYDKSHIDSMQTFHTFESMQRPKLLSNPEDLLTQKMK